jgi:hypothetical protein
VVATGEASARAQTPPAESSSPAPNGAGPPASAAPAAGSPPPGYYPPGYYPPPAYYQQPGYYPPPSAYPPPGYAAPAPPRGSFQVIPYIGVHSFQGDGGTILGPGVRIGGLVGFRVGDHVSINGELTIDYLNATRLPGNDTYTETNGTIGVSPLVAVFAGPVELAFGPKLGVWGATYFQDSSARGKGSGTYSGFDLGANGAAFTHVGHNLWFGGLASFDVRFYENSCFTAYGGIERCSSGNLPSSDKVVALSALLMFSS